ncbi:MAG TPA: hypothetical protein VFW13_00165 [Phenylobacterium sp.]|nr:hypothetical protein [Phenylobacterium sp.]
MFRRMLRKGLLVALSALALSSVACSRDERPAAAKDIATFLIAVQRNDAGAIEAALDRPALRSDLRGQLTELGRANGVDVNGGPSEFAMDRMITPQTIGLALARTALPAAAPTAAQITAALTVSDKGRVCVQDAGKTHCLLTFGKDGNAWRLVGLQAPDLKRP